MAKNETLLEDAKKSLKVNFLIGFDTTKHLLLSKAVDKKGKLLSAILKSIGIELTEL